MTGRNNMKNICQIKITIIALSLPLLLCSPVRAEHSGPYVGVLLGGNALMSAKSSDSLGNFSLEFNPALQGSAMVGWDFEPGNPVGEGRVELEYTRRSNPLDKVKFAEGSFNGSGNLTADSLLINFFGVYRYNSILSPYFGLGFGAARIKASDLRVAGYPLASGSDTVFAGQAGLGVDFALTKHLSIDLGYRFFGTSRPEFKEADGHTFKMDYFSHSTVLGLCLGF